MSLVKESTVAEVLKVSPWTGQHGVTYFHTLKMANGDIGECGKKRENAFTVGQALKYELIPSVSKNGTAFNRIKEWKEEFRGGGRSGGGYSGNPASFALSYSKDVFVALLGRPDTDVNLKVGIGMDITALADVFYDWMVSKESAPKAAPEASNASETAPQTVAQSHVAVAGASSGVTTTSIAPATPPQINAIEAIARAKGKTTEDVNKVSQHEFRCDYHDTNKTQASTLIERLKALPDVIQQQDDTSDIPF